MGPKTKWTAALAVVLLIAVTASASANLISYITRTANRERLMVMEDDGTSPVELFVGGRDTPTIEYPTVSPAGLEETWILFNDHYDLYKIRPDGSEQTLVLCGTGTDKFGAPYCLNAFDALWSPDGSEILFHPWPYVDSHGEEFLALISANHTAVQAETCTSDLVRIYEPPSPWTVDSAVAWNYDGSRIAFRETNMETEQGHLAVIERQASGAWQHSETIELIPGSPDLPDRQPFELSWRPLPESRLLIFRLKGFPERRVKFWLAAIDLDTGVWDYVLDKGNPVEMGRDSYPRWSSNGDEILFTDVEGNLVRWIYPDGDRQVVGSGIRADWQRDALDLTCTVDADCDDGNSCTNDLCNTDTGECGHTDLADNTPCGTNGWCELGTCFEPACDAAGLPDCNDQNACTIDSCSDYECLFDATSAAGLGCDDGDDCTTDDECDGFGGCAGALDETIPGCEPTSCLPKGDPCSDNSQCCSGQCHPVKGTCK